MIPKAIKRTSTRRLRCRRNQENLEWTETTKPVPTSILVPVKPVITSATTSPRGNLGVTINGLVISASAPVDAILGAYTTGKAVVMVRTLHWNWMTSALIDK